MITVHAHNFAEKLRLAVLVTSYFWEHMFAQKKCFISILV